MQKIYRGRIGGLLVACLLFLAAPASAEPFELGIGAFSFDTFIPADGAQAGTNAFTVWNLTGPEALFDDFPVIDSLTFDDLSLTLDGDDPILLDAVGPGNSSLPTGAPPFALQFPDATTFASAILTGRLAATSYLLGGSLTGFVFTPESDRFSVSLFGPAPGDLQPIVIQGDIQRVPEPGTLALIGVGLATLGACRKKMTRARLARKAGAGTPGAPA